MLKKVAVRAPEQLPAPQIGARPRAQFRRGAAAVDGVELQAAERAEQVGQPAEPAAEAGGMQQGAAQIARLGAYQRGQKRISAATQMLTSNSLSQA